MNKKLLILFSVFIYLLTIGCVKNNKNVLINLKKNIEDLSSYNLEGKLEIINNEDIYTYDVSVAYKAPELFRVSLKNINNNHLQVLLKNPDGVYVLTPALNKSFKFQSDWPYNNSQIYLLQTIIKDIENDNTAKIDEIQNNYVITSKVNYSNNDNLVNQKVYVDKNYDINKIEVMNGNNTVLMRMTVDKLEKNKNFDTNYFDLNTSLNVSKDSENIKTTSKINNIVYPMYIPSQTYLSTQNKINVENGERVILTFDGESPFMLVQETANINIDPTIIPVTGNPEIIGDSIGVLSSNSISWSNNGIDYYLTSNSLTEKELVTVANSINVLPVSK